MATRSRNKASDTSMMSLLALLGIILVSIGIYFLIDLVQFRQQAVPGQGIVIGYNGERSTGATGRTMIGSVPVIRFTSKQGRSITFTAQAGESPSWFLPDIGDPVDIHYLPNSPNEARMDGFVQNGLIPGVSLFFGTLLLYSALHVKRNGVGRQQTWSGWTD